MVHLYSRSRNLESVIESLEKIIEDTGDYFDDELTAQLNITKSWLQEALVTIRQHELRRLSLVDLLSNRASIEANVHAKRRKSHRPVNHAASQ